MEKVERTIGDWDVIRSPVAGTKWPYYLWNRKHCYSLQLKGSTVYFPDIESAVRNIPPQPVKPSR